MGLEGGGSQEVDLGTHRTLGLGCVNFDTPRTLDWMRSLSNVRGVYFDTPQTYSWARTQVYAWGMSNLTHPKPYMGYVTLIMPLSM